MVIDDALLLEEKAERTYREAAAHAANPSARRLLGLLADAEATHAAALRARRSLAPADGPDLIAAAAAWVRGAVEGGGGSLASDAGLLDLLRRAMDLERESEVFYRKHAQGAGDPHVARLLEELAEVEKAHFALISSLVEYYDRPSEWVESAEFGLRPDY